jgi:hypothetical protein
MKALFLLLLVTLNVQAAGIINDSLVRDLSCEGLSKDAVMSSIREDAFSGQRELPNVNWYNPKNALGQCWSLAHAQRILFYLGRFDEQAVEGGASVDEVIKTFRKKSDLKLFSVSRDFELSLGQETFKEAIETYQAKRFFDVKNLKMLNGDRGRDADQNVDTFNKILTELSRNRLAMVVIRAARNYQHVVLLKSVRTISPTAFGFKTYDSNTPGRGAELVYNSDAKSFDGSRILNYGTEPMGVFLVDTKDMDKIEDTLLAHYSKQCGQKPAEQTTEQPVVDEL